MFWNAGVQSMANTSPSGKWKTVERFQESDRNLKNPYTSGPIAVIWLAAHLDFWSQTDLQYTRFPWLLQWSIMYMLAFMALLHENRRWGLLELCTKSSFFSHNDQNSIKTSIRIPNSYPLPQWNPTPRTQEVCSLIQDHLKLIVTD